MATFFLSGTDNMGWSLDQDRKHVLDCLTRLGHKEVCAPWKARVIHSLWWNDFLLHAYSYLPCYTKVILTCSNFIDPSSEHFFLHAELKKARRKASLWIAPGSKQYNVLDSLGLKAVICPFFIDYELFAQPAPCCRLELCQQLNIPWEVLDGKLVLGSFQRDSLGADLSKPKFQKGPDKLVSVLEKIPDKSKFVVLLAGPRRHYIIKQFKEKNIPYFYCGTEVNDDDIELNTLNITTIANLYKLIDVYTITSVTEGGPKAAIESGAANALCFGTDVGLVNDYLHPSCIFNNIEDYAAAISLLIKDKDSYNYAKVYAADKCKKEQSLDSRIKKLKNVYNQL